MNELPFTYTVAAGFVGIYGLIALVGGLLGFRAGSRASLVAGGISGALLLLCAGGVLVSPSVSLSVAMVIALALLGRFAPKVFGALHSFRDFLRTMIGKTALAMTVGGIGVIVLCGLALASGPR